MAVDTHALTEQYAPFAKNRGVHTLFFTLLIVHVNLMFCQEAQIERPSKIAAKKTVGKTYGLKRINTDWIWFTFQ